MKNFRRVWFISQNHNCTLAEASRGSNVAKPSVPFIKTMLWLPGISLLSGMCLVGVGELGVCGVKHRRELTEKGQSYFGGISVFQ